MIASLYVFQQTLGGGYFIAACMWDDKCFAEHDFIFQFDELPQFL